MHPITVIEITMSIIFVIATFVIVLLLPKQIKKISLIISISLTVLLLLFFAVRPYWVDYQVSKKIGQLNQYLEEKYPNQEWTIGRQEKYRQNNPYHLKVEFENEKGWTYTYSVGNEKNICQNIWTPPYGKFPDDGKHFESNHCE